MNKPVRWMLGALPAVLLAVTAAPAAAPAAEDAGLKRVREVLSRQFDDLAPEDVRVSPAAGLYEVRLGDQLGYATADGKFLVSGDLFDLSTHKNLSEQTRNAARLEMLAELKAEDEIVFAPATTPRHTITVFTDVDCPFCRKLHTEIAELNRNGIAVRYVAFPRTGPNTPSWAKMEAVWCSANRQEAITQAKLGETVKAKACKTPVARQFSLGEKIGVSGTPTLFAENGALIVGYLAPKELAARLDIVAPVAAADKR